MFSITFDKQPFVYYGPTINILDSPGVNPHFTIYKFRRTAGEPNKVGYNGYSSWNLGEVDFAEFTTFENGGEYYVETRPAATFPYTLHNESETIPCKVTINREDQWIRYEKNAPTNISDIAASYPQFKKAWLYEKLSEGSSGTKYSSYDVSEPEFAEFTQLEKGKTYRFESILGAPTYEIEISDCLETNDLPIWTNLNAPPPEYSITPYIQFDSTFTNSLVLSTGSDRTQVASFYARANPLLAPNLNLGGDLTLHDCSLISAIDCFGTGINVLSAHNCPKLKTLQCSNNNLKSLDLNGSLKIQQINFSENYLKTINLSECLEIVRIEASTNLLSSIVLNTLLSSLDSIDVSNNKLTSFDLVDAPVVSTILCSYNQLSSFTFTNSSSVHTIYIDNNNNLKEVNVFGCLFLRNLYANKCDITTINIYNCNNLTYLNLKNNNLSQAQIDMVCSNMVDTELRQTTKFYNFDNNPGVLTPAQINVLASKLWFYDGSM